MGKITYPDKNTGDDFLASEATEIKTSVNAAIDEMANVDSKTNANTTRITALEQGVVTNSRAIKNNLTIQPHSAKRISSTFPQFWQHLLLKDKNINIVIVGDSIMARDYHTSYYPTSVQPHRPPLLDSKNTVSRLFDMIDPRNMHYKRYDSGRFTEVKAFTTEKAIPAASPSIPEWDDCNRRPSHTRRYVGTENASVSFKIAEGQPAEYRYRIANFIYRTCEEGSVHNTVSISEGNGNTQVYDKAITSWIEANGYVFSMKQTKETVTGDAWGRGNTKFQERLKFRFIDPQGSFDTFQDDHTITITKTDNVDSWFMYWGIEYSGTYYNMRWINAARGGLNTGSMKPFMKDDVLDWMEEEDTFTLILHEVYLNNGLYASGNIEIPLATINQYLYEETNPWSYKSLSKVGSDYWKKFEMFAFSPNFHWADRCDVRDLGTLESTKATSTTKTGYDVTSGYSKLQYQFKTEQEQEGVSYLDLYRHFIQEAIARTNGVNWLDMFEPSGKTGDSFENDVTHPK